MNEFQAIKNHARNSTNNKFVYKNKNAIIKEGDGYNH